MRATLLTMLLLPSMPMAAAVDLRADQCQVRSDYALSVDDARIRLSRDSGSPKLVEFAAGELRLDGRVPALSPADADRVRDYERRVRELLAEARAIAHEAVDIAVVAVAAVARAFEADGATGDVEAFDSVAARLHEQVDQSFANGTIDEAGVDTAIEAAMEELLPRLVAGVTAQAVKVALSGDEAAAARLEARTEALDAEIERAVERRAQALERRAAALCAGALALEAIEREWGVRHAGAALDLVEVERRD